MDPDVKHKRFDLKTIIIIGLLILVAGLIGWVLGNTNKTSTNQTQSNSTVTPNATIQEPVPAAEVKSLVSYTLPDGWKEGGCNNAVNRVYIIPQGVTLDCNASPSAPIKLYVDPEGATDCNQLQNVENVRKHICKSQFINGRKTLVALTEYPKSSEYSVDTNISRYYLDTGKGVVRAEYTYGTDNKYQMGFDELANSIRVK